MTRILKKSDLSLREHLEIGFASRMADNREVTGSNPVMPTNFSLLAGRQSHEGPSVRLLVTCLWLVAPLEAMSRPL